jgi:hypothetical protein
VSQQPQSSGSGLGRLAANFGFADDPDVETMSATATFNVSGRLEDDSCHCSVVISYYQND